MHGPVSQGLQGPMAKRNEKERLLNPSPRNKYLFEVRNVRADLWMSKNTIK